MWSDIIPTMSRTSNDNTKDQMEKLISIYAETYLSSYGFADQAKDVELEVRFGTRGVKRITKLDHDNIVRKLLSNGFTHEPANDVTYLRMSPEYIDTRTGQTRISNLRVELSGEDTIQQYCKNNDLPSLMSRGYGAVQFVVKKPVSGDDGVIKPVDVDKWNFRLAMASERTYREDSNIASNALRTWNDSKKIFRLITRNSFYSPVGNHLFRVDLSVVRESPRRGRFLQPAYTFQTSGVIDAIPKYEVEIEMIGQNMAYLLTEQRNVPWIHKQLRSVIMLVLSALQQTNYPIAYPEMQNVLVDYMKIVHGTEPDEKKRIAPRDFIGPSSYTLSVNNVAPVNPDANIPNIRDNYTVTDKADGERKLMVVGGDGKLYMIDTNMNVQFTGAKTTEKTLFNSILDGEHILHDKSGRFINLYAAFDIYFINKKDVRELPFVAPRDIKEKEALSELVKHYRLPALSEFVQRLGLKGVASDVSPIRVSPKAFYNADAERSIFQCCAVIMKRVHDGLFEYETDGLIFTPSNLGAGLNSTRDRVKNTKSTWDYSFKWKPTEFNTIDFLVSTKKTETGVDYVGNVFQQGTEMSVPGPLMQYKTLILRVGFDERKHGYINPCQDIIDDKVPEAGDRDDESGYRPMQFFPTSPYDPDAGICNIMLQGPIDNRVLLTEDGDVFGDDTIVEFRYEMGRDNGWRWVPLRVRYDKTADYLANGRNYGNAYHVANSNWNSIHNPITERMITTGDDIPDELADDDVYYNRVTGDSLTRGLRDFHNLFVKKLLITKTAKRGGTIVDLAAGKAGDLPKWIAAKASFVLGIDVSKDNIENRIDGACARYLNYRKKLSAVPDALFVHGDSTANVRSGEAMFSDKGKQIVKAVFGQGPKDATVLGKGVVKQFGKGGKGFDLTTIQFSIHYMFKDQTTCQNILRNISECTKVGGYFVSTQYDGRTVFNKLRGLKEGQSLTVMDGGRKVWEVTKRYDRDEFPDDSSSVGYAIDVYQETINKVFTEYLVNYNYVVRVMEDYGFVPIDRDEARRMGFRSSTGMFEELFDKMQNELRRARDDPEMKNEYGAAIDMTSGEKRISFLNRWMIFKKVRDVDAAAVARNLMGMSLTQERSIEKQEQQVTLSEKEAIADHKPKFVPKKLKKRIRLVIVDEVAV